MPPRRPSTPPKRRPSKSQMELQLKSPIVDVDEVEEVPVVAKMQFLSNYGCPRKSKVSGKCFAGTSNGIEEYAAVTKSIYLFTQKLWDFEHNGIRAQVFQAGLFHIYVHVEAPLDNLHYAKVFATMLNAIKKAYKTYKHNCVTVTAKILNSLNPDLFPNPETYWSPDAFVRTVKRYQRAERRLQRSDSSEQLQSAGIFSPSSIKNGYHTTAMDTVLHIYGLHRGRSGKRSRNNLVEKGWLVVQDNGLLLPGDKAGVEFADALKKYTLYVRDRVLQGSDLAGVSEVMAQGVKSPHYAELTDVKAVHVYFKEQLNDDFSRLDAEFEQFTQAKTAASEKVTRLAA